MSKQKQSTQEWYVEIDNIVHGPMSAGNVHFLVTASRIGPETPLKLGSKGRWVKAGRIQGLKFDQCDEESSAVAWLVYVLVVGVVFFVGFVTFTQITTIRRVVDIKEALIYGGLLTGGFLFLGLSVPARKCDPDKGKWHFRAYIYGSVVLLAVNHLSEIISRSGGDEE